MRYRWSTRMWTRMKLAYNDLVRRRTVVRMVETVEEPLQTDPPIFIAGLYRSGTTLTRYVLDSHSRIACPAETAFLVHFEQMLTDPHSSAGFTGLGFQPDQVRARMRSFFEYFMGNYAASRRKPRWADKSPEYVGSLDFIGELWPRAQFVIVVRNPLDQIDSHTWGGTECPDRLEPFGGADPDPRISAARYWAAQTRRLLDFEAANPQKCHRIWYEKLCEQPEEVLRPLFEFLGEPWEPEVLEFYRFQHDFGFEDSIIRTRRGFTLSSGPTTPGSRRSSTRAWTSSSR